MQNTGQPLSPETEHLDDKVEISETTESVVDHTQDDKTSMESKSGDDTDSANDATEQEKNVRKKEEEKSHDNSMGKQMVSKNAEPLKVKTFNVKEIEQIEVVKARAEEKLATGIATGFNKQVIRTEFYRDNFRTLVKVALVNSIVMVAIIIGMLVYMFQTQPDNRFFATTVDGRIMQLIPLDQESMTRSELYAWTVQAVSDTLTFGYHDYQRRLQDSTHYFTRDGWESFAEMLQQMQLIDMIGRGKLLIKAEPRSAPELEQQAVFNGRYRWVMRVNFRIMMEGKSAGGGLRTLPLRLTVERVPVLENIRGVAIKHWEVVSG